MTQGIYEFENQDDGNAYTGSSVNTENRRGQHLRMLRAGEHHSPHFQHAWGLYGEAVFKFTILEVIEDADLRLAAEQKRLDERFAAGTSYNMARDAIASMLGRRHSEESCRKMSTSHTGKRLSEEHKSKLRAASMGNHNAKGHKPAEETRQKLRNAMMGKQNALGSKRTDRQRREISERMTGNQYALGNQYWLGKKRTEKTCRKKSGAMKRWWARRRAMAMTLPVLLPNPSRPMLLWGGLRK